MTVGEIARTLGASIEGDAGLEIVRAQSLEDAGPSDISFAEGRRSEKKLQQTRAGCLLVSPAFESSGGPALIRVEAPRVSFARVIRLLHPQRPARPGVDAAARVAPSAKLGENVSIGPMAVVGENAVIGARTVVGAGSVIGEDAAVGEDSLLHAAVTLYPGVRVGGRAVLHSGCVIGADGFGLVFENGRYEKFPQVGTVEIGDDVEIGANSCVDRAALGVTRIGDGTKLDNMVHIGHNCRIGRHTVISGCTGIAGSATIGAHCMIGGAAMILGHLTIADKVQISALEFANFSAFMAATTDSVVGTVSVAANGDSLTIQNMTVSTLQGLSGQFTFA